MLPARQETVLFVSALIHARRQRLGTRRGRRALTCFQQAVLVMRWFLDGTRVRQLAVDNAISVPNVYRCLDEGIDVLAGLKPSLHAALLAAKIAGHPHVNIDGTLIYTDRCAAPGPTPGVDLWWSGKHHHHGGNVQVVSSPDGWPLWTSDVRPGREHDTTCARAHSQILPDLMAWTGDGLHALADLGYEGEATIFTVPIKKTKGVKLTDAQKQLNWLQAHARARAEQANALLKMTFKALRRVSLDPSQIGKIVAATLVLLHVEQSRTT
ncbi:transposase family protein [Micromonospora sp. NBC_01412]|uniref:HARBI1 family protein n=1 Tax=Micromonospora sp. NBC_01412 TaxID=2903590 RepID=UPI003250307F